MRKLLTAVAVLLVLAGTLAADEVTARSYDKKTMELLVANKVGKESVYKITDATKFTLVDKKGNPLETKITVDTLAERLRTKGAKGLKIDITVEEGKLTEVKLTGAGTASK